MRVFAKTDIGKVREINQDYYYISPQNDEIQLFIVADGMGGYNGGEVASKLATESVKSYINNNFNTIEHDKENIMQLIKSSIEYANMIIFEKSKKIANLDGMGTTIEVCLIYNNRAYIGHAGDSRIYRIRKEIIRRITTDHSYVEKLIKDGKITREESYSHPKKNMITKALGCTNLVEPDVIVKGFQKDDIIIMCTDGLINMVHDDEIYNIIKQNVSSACDKLVLKANEAGGYDNITLVIIENN